MTFCPVCGAQNQSGQNYCVQCGAALATPSSPPSDSSKLPYFPMNPIVNTVEVGVANFWWRVLSFLIDSAILAILIGLPLRGTSFYTLSIIEVAAAFAYFTLSLGLRGQTLGMRIVRIRCVNEADQGTVTWRQASIRSFAYCALLLIGSLYQLKTYAHPTTAQTRELARQFGVYFALAVPHYIDLLWAAWDKKRRTLHDKAAHTIVVR